MGRFKWLGHRGIRMDVCQVVKWGEMGSRLMVPEHKCWSGQLCWKFE